MSSVSSKTARPAALAGRFYPADPFACRQAVESLFRDAAPTPRIGRPVAGGVVPHAGWIYSGPTAARTVDALAVAPPDTIVVFGAVHVPDLNIASLYPAGHWQTPLGPVPIDEELATRVGRLRGVTIDPAIHAHEHSIEVELPLIRFRLPAARIVPLMLRPSGHAAEIGRRCAAEALALGRRVAFLASTDLTHYGPAFGFAPQGYGPAGVRWAKEVNDRRMLALVASADAAAVVPEAALHRNACGAGALAALLGAVRELGTLEYHELEHTSSAEREARRAAGAGSDSGAPGAVRDDAANSVGYAAAVFSG